MMELFTTPKIHSVLSELGIYLIGIDHENNKIRFKWSNDNKMRISKIQYNNKGIAYFCSNRKRYYLHNFM